MYVCIHFIFIVDREVVGKWDDALSITHLSGVASALFFCGLSKNDLNCSKNPVRGQCNSSSELQLNPNVLKNNGNLGVTALGEN